MAAAYNLQHSGNPFLQRVLRSRIQWGNDDGLFVEVAGASLQGIGYDEPLARWAVGQSVAQVEQAAVENQQRQMRLEMGQQALPVFVEIEPQDGVVVGIPFEVGFEFGYDGLGQHLLISHLLNFPTWSRDLSAVADDDI